MAECEYQLSRRKNFFCPMVFLAGLRIKFDIRQINKRKIGFNSQSTGIHTDMKFQRQGGKMKPI